MSHVVSIQSRVQDPVAIAAACRRLGLAEPTTGTAQLYSGEASGLLVQLPGWRYPAVIDTRSGAIRYDNFEGNWGEDIQLERFLQMYAVEKCRIEANRAGHQLTEQQIEDGSIRLQITEGA